MKFILSLIIILFISACAKSRTEQAHEKIKEYIIHTMGDSTGYEPVEFGKLDTLAYPKDKPTYKIFHSFNQNYNNAKSLRYSDFYLRNDEKGELQVIRMQIMLP